jgi:hypothetical protein
MKDQGGAIMTKRRGGVKDYVACIATARKHEIIKGLKVDFILVSLQII